MSDKNKVYKSLNYKYSIVRENTSIYQNSIKINQSKDVYKYILNIVPQIPDINVQESFLVLSLNSHNNTKGWICLSSGSDLATVVSPKMVCLFAIETLANSIIIAHNHPSGILIPSNKDKELTQKIKSALNLIDIYLADHIIFSEDNFKSFADYGLL